MHNVRLVHCKSIKHTNSHYCGDEYLANEVRRSVHAEKRRPCHSMYEQ